MLIAENFLILQEKFKLEKNPLTSFHSSVLCPINETVS
jgi:hypothetical protein